MVVYFEWGQSLPMGCLNREVNFLDDPMEESLKSRPVNHCMKNTADRVQQGDGDPNEGGQFIPDQFTNRGKSTSVQVMVTADQGLQ